MEARETAIAFFEKMAANAFQEAFALLSDDVNYTVIGSTPLSGVYQGKVALYERLLPGLARFKSPVKITVKEVIAEGDRAVVITSGVGEAPYGAYVQDPAIFVLRIRSGSIVDLLEFVDTVMLETRMFGSILTRL